MLFHNNCDFATCVVLSLLGLGDSCQSWAVAGRIGQVKREEELGQNDQPENRQEKVMGEGSKEKSTRRNLKTYQSSCKSCSNKA